MTRVDFREILYLAADRSYTDLHLADGSRRTIDTGLRATVTFFGRDDLLQIHKSYAVPHHAIAGFSREEIELTSGKKLPLGRAYRDEFRRVLA